MKNKVADKNPAKAISLVDANEDILTTEISAQYYQCLTASLLRRIKAVMKAKKRVYKIPVNIEINRK